MPVESKTPKKEPKAAPITKKSNLASKEHEALLQWLIEHQASICDILFGKDSDWFEKTATQAIQDFQKKKDSLLDTLDRGSGDESLPSDYRNACGAKLKWAFAAKPCWKRHSPMCCSNAIRE